jgi:hypothetical protein
VTIYVDVAISDFRERKQVSVGRVRVSSTSMLSWMPRAAFERLGIAPERTWEFEGKDGVVFKRSSAPAIVHIDGRSTIDDVIVCEAGDEPVIGWRTLGGLNLEVQEGSGRLIDRGPIPAAQLVVGVENLNRDDVSKQRHEVLRARTSRIEARRPELW